MGRQGGARQDKRDGAKRVALPDEDSGLTAIPTDYYQVAFL